MQITDHEITSILSLNISLLIVVLMAFVLSVKPCGQKFAVVVGDFFLATMAISAFTGEQLVLALVFFAAAIAVTAVAGCVMERNKDRDCCDDEWYKQLLARPKPPKPQHDNDDDDGYDHY